MKIKYSVDRRDSATGLLCSSEWFISLELANERLEEINSQIVAERIAFSKEGWAWEYPFRYDIGISRE